MAELINEKVGKLSFKDYAIITAFKLGTEEVLKPIVGNGNYKSGIVKLIGAYLVDRFGNGRVLNLVATGMAVDGMEDLLYDLKKRVFALNENSSFQTI